MILVSTPYAIDRDLGAAYNQAMSRLLENDWMFFIDGDAQFLTPDWGKILMGYVKKYPDTGLFTCYTNRIHPLGTHQLFNGQVSENFDIKYHIKLAAEIRDNNHLQATELTDVISGVLMGVSYRTWSWLRFPEGKRLLGIDNDYSEFILRNGLKIRRMDGLYIFHSYRAFDITDKSHLL